MVTWTGRPYRQKRRLVSDSVKLVSPSFQSSAKAITLTHTESVTDCHGFIFCSTENHARLKEKKRLMQAINSKPHTRTTYHGTCNFLFIISGSHCHLSSSHPSSLSSTNTLPLSPNSTSGQSVHCTIYTYCPLKT